MQKKFSDITKDTKVKVRHVSDESIAKCNKIIKPIIDANAKERHPENRDN